MTGGSYMWPAAPPCARLAPRPNRWLPIGIPRSTARFNLECTPGRTATQYGKVNLRGEIPGMEKRTRGKTPEPLLEKRMNRSMRLAGHQTLVAAGTRGKKKAVGRFASVRGRGRLGGRQAERSCKKKIRTNSLSYLEIFLRFFFPHATYSVTTTDACSISIVSF